jgi:superfamily I DNA and RNA helicase
MTQGERLTRIETILERIETKIDRIDTDQRKDIADLASLKSRGWGLVAGVGMAAGGAGAFLRNWVS